MQFTVHRTEKIQDEARETSWSATTSKLLTHHHNLAGMPKLARSSAALTRVLDHSKQELGVGHQFRP